MTNNCLVTKLKGTVDNQGLARLGEILISCPSDVTPDPSKQCVEVRMRTNGQARLISGSFANSSLTPIQDTTINIAANSNVMIYVTAGTIFAINNKYNIFHFNVNGGNVARESYLSFDATQLNYTNLNYIGLGGQNLYGKLTQLFKNNQDSMTGFSFSKNNITIDFSGMNFRHLMQAPYISKCPNITMDTSVFIGGNTINSNVTLDAMNLTGDIENLSVFNPDTKGLISVAYTKLTGDPSKLGSGVCLVVAGEECNFTWSNRTGGSIISFSHSPNFGDYLDSMLINQATLNPDPQAIDPSLPSIWRTIEVLGNRTSSSDSAVATLKSKGMKVVVNYSVL